MIMHFWNTIPHPYWGLRPHRHSEPIMGQETGPKLALEINTRILETGPKCTLEITSNDWSKYYNSLHSDSDDSNFCEHTGIDPLKTRKVGRANSISRLSLGTAKTERGNMVLHFWATSHPSNWVLYILGIDYIQTNDIVNTKFTIRMHPITDQQYYHSLLLSSDVSRFSDHNDTGSSKNIRTACNQDRWVIALIAIHSVSERE